MLITLAQLENKYLRGIVTFAAVFKAATLIAKAHTPSDDDLSSVFPSLTKEASGFIGMKCNGR